MELVLQVSSDYDYPAFEGMHSTGHFRHVVSSIAYAKEHFKKDAPPLKYKGTIKLDGTNGALNVNLLTNEVYVLSKEQYLTKDVDNNGFRAYVEANSTVLLDLVAKALPLAEMWSKSTGFAYTDVQVYGEWCGGSIVKKVALNKLPRQYVVFGIRMINRYETSEYNMRGMLPPCLVAKLKDDLGVVKNIHDFETKSIELVFDDATGVELAVAKMTDWTQEAANRCPFGVAHGVEGPGEGWVWSVDIPEPDLDNKELHPYISTRYLFKTKGKAHSVVNAEKLIEIDAEKLADLEKFVDMVISDARVDQGIQLTKTANGLDADANLPIQYLGSVVAWIVKDVFKEESDRLPSDVDMKKLKGMLSKRAANILKPKLN